MTIDELTKSIATLEAEIAEMQTQLKRAGEDREMENTDFQGTVADQRETKALLNKALDVLKAVFAKKFLQLSAKQEPVGPPPLAVSWACLSRSSATPRPSRPRRSKPSRTRRRRTRSTSRTRTSPLRRRRATSPTKPRRRPAKRRTRSLPRRPRKLQ